MTHVRILALAAILLAFLTLPAWAGQGSAAPDSTTQDGGAETPGAGQADASSGLVSWWESQETWQQWLYVLGVVAVVLVGLQVRYHWVEKTIAGVPRWIKSARVFLVEVRGEWGKVTKPSRNEVVATTIVVVVVSVIFAVYLWASDWVIMTAYQEVFKKLGL